MSRTALAKCLECSLLYKHGMYDAQRLGMFKAGIDQSVKIENNLKNKNFLLELLVGQALDSLWCAPYLPL